MNRFKKDILSIVFNVGYPIRRDRVKSRLLNEYKYKEEIENHLDILSSKVNHIVTVCEGEGLLKIENGIDGNGMRPATFVSLTHKGYQIFDSWYKKFWRFFTDDMAKILSIVSTILGITDLILIIFYQKI